MMHIPRAQAQSKPPAASFHHFRLPAPLVPCQACSCSKWRQNANKQDAPSPAPFDAELETPDNGSQVLMNPRQAWTEEAIQDLLASPAFSEDPPGHKSGFIAIVGLPNAGKSTLLNSLVGQKLAIVSPKAQSTRRRVLGIVSEDEYQLVLVDTPGVMQSQRNPLEGRMMSYVRGSMRESDAVVAIVDASQEERQEDVLAMIQPPPPPAKTPPMLVVLNKVDRMDDEAAAQLQEWWQTNCRCDKVLLASALRKTGVTAVKQWMLENIPEGPTLYPKEQVSEQPEKFFVSEIMRERVFELYDQEIPYSTQVNVLDFKERKKGKDYILVELVVERDSQKGIILGRKGAALKALASSARADIEEYLERPVYIDVTVRVDKEWRKSATKVEKFGY